MLRMTSLHHLILQHQTAAALEEITKTSDLYQRNVEGLTPLQLASILGESTVAAKICMMGGGEDFANEIKHENPNVIARSQTKLADFAKQFKHKNILNILSGLHAEDDQYGINKGLILKEHLYRPAVYDYTLNALLEFAAYCNNELSINKILDDLTKIPGIAPRCHSTIRSAAYWAIINRNKDMFGKLCLTDEDAYYALSQIRIENEVLFEEFEKLVTPIARVKLTKILNKDKEDIDPELEIAYEAACKANRKILKLCSQETLYIIAAYAYEKNNLVGLYQCMLVWKEFTGKEKMDFVSKIANYAVIAHATTDKEIKLISGVSLSSQCELLECWLVATDIHPYELIRFNKNNLPLRNYVTDATWSKEGLLNYNISRLLAKTIETRELDESLYLWLEKRDADVFHAVLMNLQIRYPAETSFNLILETPDDLPLQQRLYLANATHFSDYVKNILNSAFREFNLVLDSDSKPQIVDFNKLTNVIWMKILNMDLCNLKLNTKKPEKVSSDDEEEKLEATETKQVAEEKRVESKPSYFQYERVSSLFYLLSRSIDPDNKNDLERKFIKFLAEISEKTDRLANKENELNMIRDLQDLFETAIKNLNTCRSRTNFHALVIATLLLTVSTMMYYGYFAGWIPGGYMAVYSICAAIPTIIGGIVLSCETFKTTPSRHQAILKQTFLTLSIVLRDTIFNVMGDLPELESKTIADTQTDISNFLETKERFFQSLPKIIQIQQTLSLLYQKRLPEFQLSRTRGLGFFQPESKSQQLQDSSVHNVFVDIAQINSIGESKLETPLLDSDELTNRSSSCARMCVIV